MSKARGQNFTNSCETDPQRVISGRVKVEHVLFDLDQTLIPWDSQLLFRNHVLREEPWRRWLTFVFLAVVPLFKLLGTRRMKQVFHCYLWGMKRERLEALGEEFVEKWIPPMVYPELLEEVRRHREAGRVLVLSSASPELWVARIGKALGFDRSYGTWVEWGDEVAFFPKIIGENHKGAEKVRRLESEGILVAASGYTDSVADLPMMAVCEEVTVVNPLPGFAETAAGHGWRIVEPARPWAGRVAFGWACVRQLWGFFPPE